MNVAQNLNKDGLTKVTLKKELITSSMYSELFPYLSHSNKLILIDIIKSTALKQIQSSQLNQIFQEIMQSNWVIDNYGINPYTV